MGQKVFTYEIQVRWGDFDRLGHVNNTRFVEYMQEARVHFASQEFAAAGVRASATVVRKMDVEYLRPITDDAAPLKIDLSVLHVGTSSFTIRHVIIDRHGTICATGDSIMVAFDVDAAASRPLSEAEREVLRNYLVPAKAIS